jgi:type I restriction-modification system DNA methylase subunit
MPSRKHVSRNVTGDYRKRLIKLLDGFTGSHDRRTIFRDFVECCAIAISNQLAPSPERDKREETYLQIAKRHGREIMVGFSEGLGLAQLALRTEGGDVLGDVYQGLGIHNGDAGQFFTPFEVSSLIARMTLTDVEDTMAQVRAAGRVLRVSDPAVGGGGMLLAAAETLEDAGVSLDEVCFFGTDVDITCVEMAFTQLALLGAAAVITHGNSLSREVWSTWVTPRAVEQHCARRLDLAS